jgi:APA family basic amino acid/polyamine antiporter
MKQQENRDHGLQRRLGLRAATLAGIGVILGAGVYVLVGVAARQGGNAIWLSFLIAAAVAGLTGLSYARLGRLRPRNAPEFQYLSMAFGRTPGFLAGWLVLWATIISSAAVALGFAGYLQHVSGIPYLAGAIGLVVLSSAVIFFGIGESVILAGVLTLVEATGLVIIISIGVPSIGRVNLLEMPLGMSGVIGAASLVFFAYLGFEGMANLSEEMRNPERDLPKAMLLALGISTVFYILVAISAASVLGWQELSQSGAPLADVASRVLGSRADLLLSTIALASTANTVLLLLLAASRSMWAMSCAGVLPMSFCVIGKTRRTPWLTIILVAAFASIFALIKDIQNVAEFTNFATLLAFAGVNASALKLFAKGGAGGRLKHVFVDLMLPLAGCLASLWLAVSLGWRAALFGSLLLAVGAGPYLLMKRLSSKTS